jgi:Undecaprenyl-phosphate galactose phosphotransferase WbaP
MGNVLFVTDMLSLLIAIVLSMRVHPKLVLTIESPYISIFLLLGSTIAYLFLRRGLYPPVGMHYADELRHSVVTTSLAFLIVIGVTFALKTTAEFSRLELIGAWVLCLPLIPFSRYIVRRLLIRLGLWGESVVIVGDLQKARSVADYFKARLQYGMLPLAVLSDEFHAGDPLALCPRLPICAIKVFARNFSVKTVLVVVDDLNAIEEIVKRYRNAFQWVILIKDHYSNFGLTFLKPLDFMDVFGLQVKNNLLSNSGQMPKRVMDIILSFLGLLCLTPFLLLFALMIKLESPGRVFYRQLRMGKNGLRFNLLKFRTMYQNSAALLKEELEHDPALKQEWERYQKLKDDPRITCVGKFLRRFSLDELPQLWNVLKGEMSLVGPRPMMVDQVEMYGETIRDFFRVKPGMTGLWQVSGRNQTTFARRAELDLEYIQRWSVWLDIYIMLKTVKIVIWREGAY